jgi:hypothetical protein
MHATTKYATGGMDSSWNKRAQQRKVNRNSAFGERPSPGAARCDWLVGSENRSAAQPASIAAPGVGRSPPPLSTV